MQTTPCRKCSGKGNLLKQEPCGCRAMNLKNILWQVNADNGNKAVVSEIGHVTEFWKPGPK
jgi:hypothetical protein